MDNELDAVLSRTAKAQFDLSRQLGWQTAGPPVRQAEVELKEVFMEQGIADTFATIEQEVGAEPLPLEDDKSSAMSSLSSQLSNAAAHLSYLFWQYQQTTHGALIMLPNTLPQHGISNKQTMWPSTWKDMMGSQQYTRPWKKEPPSTAMYSTPNPDLKYLLVMAGMTCIYWESTSKWTT